MILSFNKTYSFKDLKLEFLLENFSTLSLINQIYLIKGNNGIGKTTFIEKILIPEITKNKFKFIYLSQDSDNQQYTIKSSLAVTSKKIVKKEFRILYQMWLDKMNGASILINDEFDKYLDENDRNFVYKTTQDRVKCYFIISHLEFNSGQMMNTNGYQINTISLLPRTSDNYFSKVKILLESYCP